uniref:Conotoxin n=1 Tax=Conus praecellens TaxID=128530 RepID=A0A291C2P6_CONPC|nr:conotoxin [Conus praecellens]
MEKLTILLLVAAVLVLTQALIQGGGEKPRRRSTFIQQDSYRETGRQGRNAECGTKPVTIHIHVVIGLGATTIAAM